MLLLMFTLIDLCSSDLCSKKQKMKTFFNIRQKQAPQVFCKKLVLRNFAKLTGNQLCHSLFSCEFCEISPFE